MWMNLVILFWSNTRLSDMTHRILKCLQTLQEIIQCMSYLSSKAVNLWFLLDDIFDSVVWLHLIRDLTTLDLFGARKLRNPFKIPLRKTESYIREHSKCSDHSFTLSLKIKTLHIVLINNQIPSSSSSTLCSVLLSHFKATILNRHESLHLLQLHTKPMPKVSVFSAASHFHSHRALFLSEPNTCFAPQNPGNTIWVLPKTPKQASISSQCESHSLRHSRNASPKRFDGHRHRKRALVA